MNYPALFSPVRPGALELRQRQNSPTANWVEKGKKTGIAVLTAGDCAAIGGLASAVSEGFPAGMA